jgi:hypothetical protein
MNYPPPTIFRPPKIVGFHKSIRDFGNIWPVDLMTSNNDLERKCV